MNLPFLTFGRSKTNEKHNNKLKFRNKGFLEGQYIKSAAGIAASFATVPLINQMRKSSVISKDDSVALSYAANRALKDTGLYDKDVRILKFNEIDFNLKDCISKIIGYSNCSIENIWNIILNAMGYNEKDKPALGAIKEEIVTSLNKNNRFSNFMKRYANNLEKQFGKEAANKEMASIGNLAVNTAILSLSFPFKIGQNAAFLPHTNKIITPNKHLQTSVFHEMGHALNANGGIILKTLQKMRPMAMAIPGYILLVSLLNKRTTTDKTNENDTKLQKGADFIKRNAEKLTLLSMLPMVLEEGIASLRGQKIAKTMVENSYNFKTNIPTAETLPAVIKENIPKILSKDLYKKIKTTNALGFASYCIAAITAALTTKLAIKVKDNIQEDYEAKKIVKQIRKAARQDS